MEEYVGTSRVAAAFRSLLVSTGGETIRARRDVEVNQARDPWDQATISPRRLLYFHYTLARSAGVASEE